MSRKNNVKKSDTTSGAEKKYKSKWWLWLIGLVLCAGTLILAFFLNNQYEGNVDGSPLTDLKDYEITKGGSYSLSGDYQCVKIRVSDDVKLILDGASITCGNGPAIYVENAKVVEVVLRGSNIVSATTTDALEGVIHSTDDLIFSGEGTLTISGNLDGIVSKDTLTIKSGTYNITTGDDCIKARDSVVINSGAFNLISADGDAIKATNNEDSKLGYIVIKDGDFNIQAGQDGIQSETYTTIYDGKLTIAVGDDGIHATTKLEINGGEIAINGREGLEATYVLINDGKIKIEAMDDGINAGEKSKELAVGVEVNGGEITIDMGAGDTDAVDSNGFLKITGGTFDITAQSPFDYDGTLTYSGGTIIVNGVTVNKVTSQFAGDGGGGPVMPGRR